MHHNRMESSWPMPIRTAPRPWEDLASLVSRVAERMGYKNPAWVLRPEEIPHAVQPYTLCRLRASADYLFLERLLRLSEECLYQLTLHRFASHVQPPGLHHGATEEVVKRPLLKRHLFQSFCHPYSATKVCPHCLAEDPAYGRLYWSVLPVVACLRHKIFLIDACPACQQAIPMLRRVIAGCPRCKVGDYRKAPAVPLPEDLLFLEGQALILDRLGVGRVAPYGVAAFTPLLLELPPWQYFQLLDAFRYVLEPVFPDASFLRVAPELRALLPRRQRPRGAFSPPEWSVFSATFHALFTSWPDHYLAFLDALPRAREGRSRKRDHARQSGVQRDFGVFYEKWLYKRLADPAFSFLHETFETYLRRYYTGGEITSRLFPFRNAPPESGRDDRPYLTKAQARATLGIGEQMLQTLMRQGALEVQKKPTGQSGKRALYLFDKASVEALRREWDGLFPLDTLASCYLGVTKGVVLALERAELLVPARGPYIDGYNIRLYRATDVERFAARLLHRAVKATVLAPAQVTLPQAARVIGIPLVSILVDVLDGYPVPMDLDTDLPLLQRLTLPRDEIQRYLGERERRRREELGLLTAREAAAQLGVDDWVLRLWIRRGLLPSERLDGRGKRSRLVIRRKALIAFRRTYLWTEEAAEYLGIVAQTVHKYVRKGILHPVAGRRVGDGSNRLLFLREEVEALLPAGSLTVQEAAHLLGVSPSRAYAIIRLGKLKSVAIPAGGSTTIRIQRGELEAYRREIGKGDIQT